MNNALITAKQRDVLLANGRESMENPDFDPAPVVKLFTRTPARPSCLPRSIPMTTTMPFAFAISA